ncbi:zf-HC2 domain-containing protein [Blastococcus deserti]|uniref:Zf-HC2 domain-containing protein n=1 Tax=Blastococcus deserti TaxID=2259033 RepID=A0ABW4XDK8_9ACTN
MTCSRTPELGGYVLGALSPDERRRVEQHVAGCRTCATELAELRPLPPLLDRVHPEDLASVRVTPSPELFDRVAAAVRRRPERRTTRTRVWLAAAAVAVVLGAGAGGAVWALRDEDRTWTASSGRFQLTVTASAAGKGSALDITVAGLAVGQVCALVVVDREGDRHPAGEWTASRPGEASWRGWTEVAPSSLSEILLLGDDGRPLVRVDV